MYCMLILMTAIHTKHRLYQIILIYSSDITRSKATALLKSSRSHLWQLLNTLEATHLLSMLLCCFLYSCLYSGNKCGEPINPYQPSNKIWSHPIAIRFPLTPHQTFAESRCASGGPRSKRNSLASTMTNCLINSFFWVAHIYMCQTSRIPCFKRRASVRISRCAWHPS